MPETTTIPHLILRAQRGNREATARLYELYHAEIYRFLAYRTGDADAAADLTGDVFLKMVEALPHYRSNGAPFRAWLYQIARNLAIDHYRRGKSHPQENLSEQHQASAQSPEEAVQSQNQVRDLYLALQRLPEDQRDVLVMRFLNGLPLAEVARILHRSEDAIKGLQRRGLMALREELKSMEVPNV